MVSDIKIKKNLYKNTFFCGLSTLIIGLVSFFLMPFMVLKLGVVQYGIFSIANILSIAGYMSLFELGFQGAITRFTAKYNEEEDFDSIFTMITIFVICFVVLGLILMFLGFFLKDFLIYIFHISNDYKSLFSSSLNLIFLSYLFVFPSIVYIGILSGLQRFDVLKTIEIITFLLYAGLVLFFLSQGKSFEYAIYSNLVCLFSRFVLYIISVKFLLSPVTNMKLKFSGIKEVIRMAKLLFVMRLSGFFYYNLPRLVVAVFLNPVFVTYYEIVTKIPRTLKSTLGFVNGAVLPAASVLSARDDIGRVKKLLRCGMKYQLFILVPIVITGIIFSKNILSIWISSEYVFLAPLLQIMFIWNLVIVMTTFTNSIMSGLNKNMKEMALFSWISLFLSGAIMFSLLPLLNLKAVILGYTIGPLVWIPFIFIFSCKAMQISKNEVMGLFLNSINLILIPAFIIFSLKDFFINSNLLGIITNIFCTWLIFSFILWVFYLKLSERKEFLNIFKV
ncbi:MAG: oligosaccharide flippase family protein [Candidatus Omnitrophota bacterium]